MDTDDFETIKLNDIKPAEYNPRVISVTEFDKLTRSIREFGLVDPILINTNNNRIIGGHQRFDVLVEENNNTGLYDELLLLRRGDIGWVFTKDLLTVEDENHEKALNISLNKITGDWDYPKLNNILDDLVLDGTFDISLTGFDNLDLNMLGEEGLDELDIGSDSLGGNNGGYNQSFMVIVDCEDESVAEDLYNGLINEGYKARIKY